MIRNRFLDSLSLFLFTIALGFRFAGGTVDFISPFGLAIIAVLLELSSLIRGGYFIKSKNIFYFWTVLAFIILMFSSLMWTHSVNYGFNKSIYLSFWVFSFSVFSKNVYENFLDFNKYLVLSFSIVLFLFYLNFGSPWEISRDISRFYRLGDDTTNPITSSRFFGIGILAVSYLYLSKYTSRLLKIFLLSIMATGLFYMFITGSKGPLLALIFSFIFLFIFEFKTFILNHLKYVIPVLLVIINYGIPYFANIDAFLSQRFFNSENSYSTRVDRYDVALDAINDSANFDFLTLLFGAGVGNYSFQFEGRDFPSFPHNIFLEILYELGFMGLFLFIILVFIPPISVIKLGLSNEFKFLISFWIFMFINSLFSGDISHNFLLFGFSILLLNGNTKYHKLKVVLS